MTKLLPTFLLLVILSLGVDLACQAGSQRRLVVGVDDYSAILHIRDAGVLASGAIWSLNEEGLLVVLDPETGIELARVSSGARLAQVSSLGDRIVGLGESGGGYLFEGPELTSLGTFDASKHVLLVAGGERVLAFVAESESVHLLDVNSGQVIQSSATGAFRELVASADGETLATLDEDWVPHLWTHGELVDLPERIGDARSIALEPSGRWLAIGTNVPHVQVIEVTTGAVAASVEPEVHLFDVLSVRELIFDSTGERLILTVGSTGSVHVYGTSDWEIDWMHDYGGGNSAALIPVLDSTEEVLWIYGMTDHTQLGFGIETGYIKVDLRESGLGRFATGPGSIVARDRYSLFRLDQDGRIEFERMDFGSFDAAVLRDEGLFGSADALARVLVEVGGERVRGDNNASGQSK